VWRLNGQTTWVLIHIEIQTQRERGFMKRMEQYNNRLRDRFNRSVVSLAILADAQPHWRPSAFRETLWGWTASMTFPVVKLLDYAPRETELEADDNPFALIVLAHLKALETRADPLARRSWKFRLVRGLYERGFDAEELRKLFRLIDWLMELPPALETLFWQDVNQFQEGQVVPFITTPERYGIRVGLLQAIEDLLRVKFGEEGVALLVEIRALEEAEKYLAVHNAIAQGMSGPLTLDDVRRAIAKAASPPPPPPKKRRTKRGTP
jgi:hypothetical protein